MSVNSYICKTSGFAYFAFNTLRSLREQYYFRTSYAKKKDQEL